MNALKALSSSGRCVVLAEERRSKVVLEAA
jgi:hypothetical protein